MARVDPPSVASLVCFKSETTVVVTTRKERGYFDEFVSVLSKDHHLCLTQVLFRQYSFILRHICFGWPIGNIVNTWLTIQTQFHFVLQ